MSQEIINVLNYLGEQLGIVIDWTVENAIPQVMDILARYRLLEIISGCLWILVEVTMIIIALAVVTKCIKASVKIKETKKDNFWWNKGYSTIWLSGIGMTIIIITAIAGVGSICTISSEVNKLLKWIIVPEVKYLELLRGFVG